MDSGKSSFISSSSSSLPNQSLPHEALVLDGKRLAANTLWNIKVEVQDRGLKGKRAPGLGVILVGDDPASKVYVAHKEKAAAECGFVHRQVSLPTNSSMAEVSAAIDALNLDPHIDGILLQLPVPAHLDSSALIERISKFKDVDGLTSVNQGIIFKGGTNNQFVPVPCTPSGVMKLIDFAYAGGQIGTDASIKSLAGLSAVVIGRSVLVGRPVAALLLARDATVTMAHSKSPNLAATSASADILIAAVGRPRMVTSEWVKPGALVIDVGINRLPDGTLVGDVDFASVSTKCGAITPVPKGVGPMTVACLMENTLRLCESRI